MDLSPDVLDAAVDAAFAAEVEHVRTRRPDGRNHGMPPRDQVRRLLEAAAPILAGTVAQNPPECPIEAVFGGADEERYPCTYAKGHDGPHSFEGANPPSVADLASRRHDRSE